MPRNDQYKDLVDAPSETLAVEYKSWLDLSDNEARADLARHIAAIANHGGGMIVFGFNDGDLTYAGANPHGGVAITRDTISSIIKKYLEPTFHCDVEIVRSGTGNSHPIVIIPSHGSTPICSKASGPQVGGRTTGIATGTYYIRKPGPESERIVTAAEWAPIIRRCALHERTSILSAISVAIRGEDKTPAPDRAAELKAWHDAAFRQFQSDVKQFGASPELVKRNIQFSYMIVQSNPQRLDLVGLRDSGLLQMNNEVKDRVRTGFSMMYPFTRSDIAPHIMVDESAGQEEFLECRLLRAPSRMDFAADMWRMTADGKVSLIRPYWEDDTDLTGKVSRMPGPWLSPNVQSRSVAEFVRHAQAFAERFESAESVLFRCEWRGLRDRILGDPAAYFSIDGQCAVDSRITTAEVSVGSLASAWPELVSDLVAPVVRLFNGSFQVTPAYVRGRAPTWLQGAF